MTAKGFLIGTGVVVGIIALVLGIYVIKWQTAPIRGKVNAREQIYSAGNRIAQYEHFYALCASVQTAEQNISALRAQQNDTMDTTDKSIIADNITANTTIRNDAVNTYNADAANHYTKGQFLASNLPFRLSPAIPEGGTQCAA